MVKIIIDLSKKEISLDLTFQGLSRVKNYKDFMMIPFSRDRLAKIKKSKGLEPGKYEEERMDSFDLITFGYFRV